VGSVEGKVYSVLHGVEIVQVEEAVLGMNVGHSIVANWDFVS